MSKKAIWISYDLGIKGDFPGLYAWLDNNDAKEAGNSVAFLNYEFNGTDAELLSTLKKDLEKNVAFKPGDRVYVVRMRLDEGVQKISGKFIIGNRRASPWEGYGQKDTDISDGDE
ncbi:hypothetical protein C9994_04595 [Marivirga lumbricoides]|uniref:Uncharacterized protein n=1 Tax=Marivirga lumbricoides TaxID=1046115 RepID=A0A2T4DTB2_9BACT|nr:hypothetical protein C9994_04595 [Marivirga lumbricoides]